MEVQQPVSWMKGVATGILIAVVAAFIYDLFKVQFMNSAKKSRR